MNEAIVLAALLGVIAFQQYTIQKLVNKVMSRNFHEYETAVSLNKPVKVKMDNVDVPEDLRSLQEYSLG